MKYRLDRLLPRPFPRDGRFYLLVVIWGTLAVLILVAFIERLCLA